MNKSQQKPLGRKNYGHIPHLEGSRMGPADHKCSDGQARIATVQVRDKHDEIFLQEKSDGSNVGVARIGDQLHPLTRSGYPAITSSFLQHKCFHNWVFENVERFMDVLEDGERLVGEWLMQAHGTRYCVHPSTPILFGDLTWKPAGSVFSGAELVAFDEFVLPQNRQRHWRRSFVIDASPIIRPSYKVILSDGTQLISSAEHLWLVKASSVVKWTRTDQLRGISNFTARGIKHKFPSQLCRLLDVWGEDNSKEAGYLAGVFDGEGSLSYVHRNKRDRKRFNFVLTFSQKDNIVVQKVLEKLNSLNFSYGISKGERNVLQIRINGGIPEKIRFLGKIRPYRLLQKFNLDLMGEIDARAKIVVEEVEFIGNCELIGFSTTTKTFIADGFGSHNCLHHEPFVAFDLMREDIRLPYDQFVSRLKDQFIIPKLLHRGGSLGIPDAMSLLNTYGFHGATDPVEGVVWRVERDNPTGKKGETVRKVDFLVKYVRPDKVDGIYLPEVSGKDPIWNWFPK